MAILYAKRADGEWTTHSEHPSDEEAQAAGKKLLAEEPEVRRVRVGGEVWTRGPHGLVMEVMED